MVRLKHKSKQKAARVQHMENSKGKVMHLQKGNRQHGILLFKRKYLAKQCHEFAIRIKSTPLETEDFYSLWTQFLSKNSKNTYTEEMTSLSTNI